MVVCVICGMRLDLWARCPNGGPGSGHFGWEEDTPYDDWD